MVMLGRCLHFMGLYPTLGCHGTQNVLHKHNVLPFHMELVVIHIYHRDSRQEFAKVGGILPILHVVFLLDASN